MKQLLNKSFVTRWETLPNGKKIQVAAVAAIVSVSRCLWRAFLFAWFAPINAILILWDALASCVQVYWDFTEEDENERRIETSRDLGPSDKAITALWINYITSFCFSWFLFSDGLVGALPFLFLLGFIPLLLISSAICDIQEEKRKRKARGF